ncbi:MAG: hypothetical protein J5607_08475 [Clostridiales bacterium]|nr:hypothetical protein [Clostridiales bacterium]
MTENNGTQKSSGCYVGFFLSIASASPILLGWLLSSPLHCTIWEDLIHNLVFSTPVGFGVALYISKIGVKEARKYNLKGEGLGVAGFTISLVFILFFLTILFVMLSNSFASGVF